MRERRLTLNKELGSELTTGELGSVAGAYSGPTCGGPCRSDFQQCITADDECLSFVICSQGPVGCAG